MKIKPWHFFEWTSPMDPNYFALRINQSQKTTLLSSDHSQSHLLCSPLLSETYTCTSYMHDKVHFSDSNSLFTIHVMGFYFFIPYTFRFLLVNLYRLFFSIHVTNSYLLFHILFKGFLSFFWCKKSCLWDCIAYWTKLFYRILHSLLYIDLSFPLTW